MTLRIRPRRTNTRGNVHRRSPVAGALAAVLVVSAGCGAGSTAPRSYPIPTNAHATQVQIAGPRAGTRVAATLMGATEAAATTVVTGWADPSTTILVSSNCHVKGCEGIARADGRGRWEAKVRLVAPLRRLNVSVSALYADADVGGPEAQVALRLKAPKPRPKPRGAPNGGAGGGPVAATRQGAGAATTASLPSTVTSTSGSGPRTLIMIGDSLAVGTESLLPAYLPGWRVSTNAQTGRPLSTGMSILGSTPVPSGPVVLAFSLFTNDSPGDVSALDSAVRESVRRAGPHGCAVWATIVRPAQGGVSYASANASLTALANGPLAGHLIVVPWAEAIRQHPDWVGGDGVHGTSTGYRARAEMYAQAAQACTA